MHNTTPLASTPTPTTISKGIDVHTSTVDSTIMRSDPEQIAQVRTPCLDISATVAGHAVFTFRWCACRSGAMSFSVMRLCSLCMMIRRRGGMNPSVMWKL